MITVATLLLIGRDAACDLGMGGRNARAVVDVTGRSLPLSQDAVGQGLAPLKLSVETQDKGCDHPVYAFTSGDNIKMVKKLTSGAFLPNSK